MKSPVTSSAYLFSVPNTYQQWRDFFVFKNARMRISSFSESRLEFSVGLISLFYRADIGEQKKHNRQAIQQSTPPLKWHPGSEVAGGP